MPVRTLWAVSLAFLLFTPLFAGSADAQDDIERAAPVPANRVVNGALNASLARIADGSTELVTVRVDFSGPDTGPRAAVAASGGKVLDARGSSLKVELPASALRGLAASRGVRSVTPLLAPDPLAVVSQGVATTGADDWHALGLTGSGVKVAVIDFGFAGYNGAIASGDLPTSIKIKDYCFGSIEANGPHGTGVAEIVYDVAPDAEIFLVCVDDIFDLEKAVDYAIGQGIDIINHSAAWFLADRGDGSSTEPSPSNAARRADEAGILWVAAAGNYAEDHWKGDWNPIEINDIVLQRFGTNSNATVDFDLSTVVAPGDALSVFLKWDNWPTTNEDFDLYLFDALSNQLAVSAQDQFGLASTPGEAITWVNTSGGSKTVFIEIREFKVTNPGELDMLIFGHNGLEYPVAKGSIADPAFSPHAVAVGASCFANNQIQYFSSLGPTIDDRIKPDFVSADGVVTNAFGGTSGTACDGFIGTSAAAPHVAGMAALIMHAAPNWTKDRVVEALEDYAVDRGSTGKDNTFGLGDIILGALPAEDCSPLSGPVTGIAGPKTIITSVSGPAPADGSYVEKNNDGSFSICIDPGTPAPTSAAAALAMARDQPVGDGSADVLVGAERSISVAYDPASPVPQARIVCVLAADSWTRQCGDVGIN